MIKRMNPSHADPRNTTDNPVNIYTDIQYPWIRYYGTRPKSNPNGPRSVWYVRNERTQDQVGPFTTLRMAKTYVHGMQNVDVPPIVADIPSIVETPTIQNGNNPPGPENDVQLELDLVESKPEPKNDLIEINCPHCGKLIVGIVGKG